MPPPSPRLFPLGPCMLTLIYGFFFLRFSEDIVEDIQKEMDAMMQDIKTDKGLVAETANVGKVPYFLSFKSTLLTNADQKPKETVF